MNRIKIGIEVPDEAYHNADFTQLLNGNPGIGGISYKLLLLGYSLAHFTEKYEVIYFNFSESNKFPKEIENCICDNHTSMIEEADKKNVDILIVNGNKTHEWYKKLRTTELKVLVRAGCYFDKRECEDIKKTRQIARVIFISSEEYDFFGDDDIIERAVCVENMMSFSKEKDEKGYMQRKIDEDSSHRVAYIGSLVPQKGFERLARVWPKVLMQIPDAHLDVIGSGKLYGTDNKLGRYGIAEENFERRFMRYLTDKDGNIMESVNFAGIIRGVQRSLK